MCGWEVKLCDPLVTHGPYLSALEIKGFYQRWTWVGSIHGLVGLGWVEFSSTCDGSGWVG